MKASIQNNLVYRRINDLIVPYFILYVYIEIMHGSLAGLVQFIKLFSTKEFKACVITCLVISYNSHNG